jgi:hypothetical protein
MEALFGEALKGGNGPWFALVVILLAMQWYDRKHNAAQDVMAEAMKQMADTLKQFCSDINDGVATLLERTRKP